MGLWFDDVRYAVRRLWQRPGFTLIATATLALGLGANIAIFTLVYGISYQPLPVRAPGELVRLGDDDNCCVNSGLQERYSLFSFRAYEHLRDGLPQLASISAFQANPQSTAVRRVGADMSDSVDAVVVTATYFQTLGVSAAAGRLLEPADDRPDASPVFVVSHRLWRDRLGSDPNAVGAAFVVGGLTMTLAGVTEPTFFGETRRPDPPDVWLPIGQEPALRTSGSLLDRANTDWLRVIGRLASGQSAASVEPAATALMRQWLMGQSFVTEESQDDVARAVVPVVSAEAGVAVLRFGFQQQLMLLFVMSGFVLVVASANLANLLLARTDRGQAAIRVALGASAGRLIRQSLTEGVVLAMVGAAAGVLVAAGATRLIVSLVFPHVSMMPIDVSPSPAVLGFAAVLALVTGAVFATAPALAVAHTPPMDALRGAGRGGERKSVVPQRALVVAQVALSFVLLTGAGLLTQSLRMLEGQTLGFTPDNRMVARLDLPASYAGDVPRLSALFRTLRERLAQVPGVSDMTYALYTPMEGNNWSGTISIDGIEATPDQPHNSSWNRVAPNFFEALDIRIREGRSLTATDTPASPRVAVVNQTFVDRFLSETSPIGRRIGIGADRPRDYEIVGVADDVKFSNAHLPTRPMIFVPDFQLVALDNPGQASTQARSTLMRMLVLETRGASPSLEPELRQALADVDPNLTLVRLMSMDTQVAGNFRMNRLLARLTSTYGLLALALATLGLYAVTAYHVSRRRREIGLRMALGADRAQVVREVVRGAVAQTIIGLAVGVPAALLAANTIAAQLYGVTTRDPLIIAGAVGILLVCALLSAAVPARRAASVNPTTALRAD